MIESQRSLPTLAINGIGEIGIPLMRWFSVQEGSEQAGLVAVNQRKYLNPRIISIDPVTCNFYGDFSYKDVDKVGGHNILLAPNGKEIQVFNSDAIQPFSNLSVDAVFDCIGENHTDPDVVRRYIQEGIAKKVFVTGPFKTERPIDKTKEITIVQGINENEYDGQDIISTSSCTSTGTLQSLEAMGIHIRTTPIKRVALVTVHATTNSESPLQKSSVSDKKTSFGLPIQGDIKVCSSGAEKEIPGLSAGRLKKGQVEVNAFRVDADRQSWGVVTVDLDEPTSLEKVLANIEENTAESGRLHGRVIMPDVAPVSSREVLAKDKVHRGVNVIIDKGSISVADGGYRVKYLFTYDNVIGYMQACADIAIPIIRK